jgi:hypothetical protein
MLLGEYEWLEEKKFFTAEDANDANKKPLQMQRLSSDV